jgi:hypothetical protein
VSFFITSIAFATYVVVRLAEPIGRRLRRKSATAASIQDQQGHTSDA